MNTVIAIINRNLTLGSIRSELLKSADRDVVHLRSGKDSHDSGFAQEKP